MAKSRKRVKSKPALTPQNALKALMALHSSLRPLSTVTHCLQNALAAYAEDGELQGDHQKRFPINVTVAGQIVVHGWEVNPPWEDRDEEVFLAILQHSLRELVVSPTPPAAFPTTFARADSPEILWQHLDYLGFRGVACLGERAALEAERMSPYVQAQIQGMRLLREFDRLGNTAGNGHAFDSEGLLGTYASLLARGHAWITEHAIIPRAEWPAPDLPDVARPPATLGDAQIMLASMGVRRPLGSALRWTQYMAIVQRSANPLWSWMRDLDGREIACTLFDQSIWSPCPPWSAEDAARFAALATALYETGTQKPLPAPPRLADLEALDFDSLEAPEALWDHLDRLHAAYLTLVMEGWATFETKGASKEEREFTRAFMEMSSVLLALLGTWTETKPEVRMEMKPALAPLLAMQYQRMEPRLKRVDQEVRDLLPPDRELTEQMITSTESWVKAHT